MKVKWAPAVCLCLLAAGLLGWWRVQHPISRQLRLELAGLQQQVGVVAALREDNQALSDTIVHQASDRATRAQQVEELQRLRQEAANLRLELTG